MRKGGGGKGKPSNSEWTFVNGNKRDNVLTGTDGKDWINGRDGDDTLLGGSGDDMLQGNVGSDILDGGSGHDVASFVKNPETSCDPVTDIYTGLVFMAQDHGNGGWEYLVTDPTGPGGDVNIARNVEEIWGTNNQDVMIGGSGDDYFVGARDDDTLYGNDGADTLYGSLGDDTIYAGSGDGDEEVLIFLRRVYDYNGDDIVDDILGDGVDVVYDFEVDTDRILFLNNEVDGNGDPAPDFNAEDYAVSDPNDASNTLIHYADESSILLVGVAVGSVTDALFLYEYADV